MKPFNITNTFIALDDSNGARPLPVTADFWPKLISGQLGPLSRMISCLSHDSDWTSWERHPAGEEMVCLIEGEVELHLELEDGSRDTVVLAQPGDYVLVPKNAWHTAKVRKPGRMFFVTPGQGTENRPV
jgi:mannose-6-phosphate isomerase-like protein (cupin superfamily)